MSKELAEVIVENDIVHRLGEQHLHYPELGMPEGTHYNIGKYGLMNNVRGAVEEIVLKELIYVLWVRSVMLRIFKILMWDNRCHDIINLE